MDYKSCQVNDGHVLCDRCKQRARFLEEVTGELAAYYCLACKRVGMGPWREWRK